MAELLIKAFDVIHADPALNNQAYKRGYPGAIRKMVEWQRWADSEIKQGNIAK